MAEATQQRSYKKTLNLPKTAFPMKANLVQNEPQSLKRWGQGGLYAAVRRARDGAPPFVFHDGPPYANGSIHLGHLLNKVLKDFVVRSRSMMGYDTPYVPGWDCHGLPIEHKVMQEQKAAGDGVPDDRMRTRKACRKYAEKHIKLQSGQMQRLLTLADYSDPYLTMNPPYEAATLEVFAEMVGRGLVYRGLKPVHWSIENRTALAEAELEYEDREDTSVFARFPLTAAPDSAKLPGTDCVDLVIWTTTPWTLPANLAVAVHPRAEYGVYAMGDRVAVLATDLAGKVFAAEGQDAPEPHGTLRGEDLVGAAYRHPFLEDGRQRRVVAAEYVTLEDGTGLVHTAPGHGVEDYQTGLREGLEIYCPVRGDGTFDGTAPDWLRGKSVWEANGLVVDRLKADGRLWHANKFRHSYPHDWRSKTPVIFRATEQWFVAVDERFDADGDDDRGSLRDRALAAAANDIAFHPAWGRNRLRGMLESRPDWCISRQRAWGLPIPAFYPPEGTEGDPLLTRASVLAVAEVFEARGDGSDAWFKLDAAELLQHYDPAADPDAPAWVSDAIRDRPSAIRHGLDIFDVWFESGSSWHACMERRGLAHDRGSGRPVTDLYLEGSDQHRGWFQLSMLPSLAVTGRSPFAAVLTHGFMVDKAGRKLSKSAGHTVEGLFEQYGADVLRWWVASLNPDNDIKVDDDFFKEAGEEYRKVRNTLRFVLGTLDGFKPGDHAAPEPTSLDAWVLAELSRLTEAVTEAYGGYTFRKAHEAVFNFCNDTLSAVYLTAVKDRLYCDPPAGSGGERRRRTQATLHTIADTLTRLLAPLMPHTADEAWRALVDQPRDDRCVHLETLPEPGGVDPAVAERWAEVMRLRDGWLKALEARRQSTDLDNPLDAGLRVPDADGELGGIAPGDLADLCGVSRFEVGGEAVEVVDLRDEPKCERCWRRTPDVAPRSDGGELCDRCAGAVGV